MPSNSNSIMRLQLHIRNTIVYPNFDVHVDHKKLYQFNI